jgi:undecaprenyl-diphosphatase
MTTWEAIFLGAMQGLTEFLPVSSSGHLELGQYLLGYHDLHRYILFNLICHLGTLCAIGYIFFDQIKRSFTNRAQLMQIVWGTLPLFPLVLILKPIKAIIDQPHYLGICFLFSAFLIFLGATYHFKRQIIPLRQHWTDPLTIGLFQAVAILPGVSRSGATISAARLLGWQKEEAISFSFLLAIPAILGGTALEIIQVILQPASLVAPISSNQFLIGFLTSFFVGCFALRLLMRMMVQDKWIYFAWYCLGLGILTTIYFNFFG